MLNKSGEPIRTCLGCRCKKSQKDLIRIAYRQGKMQVDPAGKAPGRGMYLCREGNCLDAAFKNKAFQRMLKRQITDEEKRYLIDEIKKQG